MMPACVRLPAIVFVFVIGPVLGAAQGLAELSRSLQQLAQRIAPSVVQIFVTASVPGGGGATESLVARERSTGSGVILDSDGYIVTNAHVVENAVRIQVELAAEAEPASGRPARSIVRRRGRLIGAQIVGIDRETDLAVLKIDAKGLPVLSLGDSDTLRPGHLVLALGSPLGLETSVSLGVVSAVARQLESESPMIYIQTDAPINPGSSGGPLVDTEGRVVGINTLIYSRSGGNEGIGFAAPSNIVRNVFEQMRKTGRVRRGEIGVYAQTITPVLAAGLGLSRDWGVVLGDVDPGGPADRAGLRIGDVVLTLDGKPMENGRQFQVNFYAKPIGSRVAVEVLRGSRSLTVTVPVAERSDDPERFSVFVNPPDHLVPRLGLLGITLDRAIAQLLPDLRQTQGVVVAATAVDTTPLQQGSFRPGDVIYAVNGRPVTTLVELRAVVAALKPGDPIVVQLERDGRLMFVGLTIE